VAVVFWAGQLFALAGFPGGSASVRAGPEQGPRCRSVRRRAASRRFGATAFAG